MGARLTPPNAILFVLDRSHRAVSVPEYRAGQIAAANRSCISIGTRADVDGDVAVEVFGSGEGTDTSMVEVYEGEIETPGRKLAVVTSEFDVVVEFEVRTTTSRVAVRVDDPRFPSLVRIVAQ